MSEIIHITHKTGILLSEYSSVVIDSGDLSISKAAALVGNYGLQCVIDDTTAIYGEKTFAQLTSTVYRARFYIDPNNLTMASGDIFRIFEMRNDSTVLAFLSLRYDGSDYGIVLTLQDDGGSFPGSSSYVISDDSHYVEIRVEYASSSMASDASGTLYIDGIQKEQVTGQDIFDIAKPTRIRVGATLGLDAGTSGTFYLDDVIVRNDDTEIGAAAEVEELAAISIPDTIRIASHHQSQALSIVAEDPLYLSTRTFSDRISEQINSYSHELRAIGGFYSAKIDINDRQSRIEDWIEYGLGRHIEVYNPALVVIWEGFVNSITATLGGLQFQIGPLLDIGNRISVTYSTIDTSVDPPILGVRETTAVANNTDSQALYGIIQKIVGINGATAAQAEQLRDSFANDPNRAYPATSRNSNLSSNSGPSVSLECLGYWHWLKAYYYSNSATGTVNLSTKIQDLLGADPNGIFSTDYSQIASNTFQVTDSASGSETAETIMKRLNSYGDSSDNPYTMGFYAGQKFSYQAMPTEVEYQQRIRSNIGITDKLDGEVKPWDVQAGKWIFYPDFLVGRNIPISASTLGLDPRAGFNESVQFTAPWELSVNGIKVGRLDQMLAKRGIGGMA